ncbi:MAG: family transposase [Haloplasmataceae bacterium]|nr:family transposase [Haloplasmataceae bacterium]
MLVKLEIDTGTKPEVILEATGHYSDPVVKFVLEEGYKVISINLLIAKQMKQNKLRKTKTDKIDCQNFVMIYYQNQYNKNYLKDKLEGQLQSIHRDLQQKIAIQTMFKNNFKQQLVRIFPIYGELFSDIYCEASFQILLKYTHPKCILKATKEELTKDTVKLMGMAKAGKFILNKVERLIELANNCYPCVDHDDYEVQLLQDDINQIINLQKLIEARKDLLINLTKQIKLFEILKSIKGIGEQLAAQFIAEVSNLDRFETHNQLIAYAGIEPSVYQSGKYNSKSCSITKRGNSTLRHILYMMVTCAIRFKNVPIKLYFNKKRRLEGKPYKVVIVACMNKLLRIIYALYQKNEFFQQV